MIFDEKRFPTGKFKNILIPDQPHFEIIEYEYNYPSKYSNKNPSHMAVKTILNCIVQYSLI